jgi:hypothetical protein
MNSITKKKSYLVNFSVLLTTICYYNTSTLTGLLWTLRGVLLNYAVNWYVYKALVVDECMGIGCFWNCRMGKTEVSVPICAL